MATIKELREKRRLSQFELAVAVGVTPGTVSHWERGLSRPRFAQVRKLADTLEVDADEIVLPEPRGNAIAA